MVITAYQPTTPSLICWGTEVLLMATSDRLSLSHSTKMEEPQTVVSPLLGLISMADEPK